MSSYKINVKCHSAQQIQVEVTEDMTVLALKAKLESETKTPSAEIKLIFKGKILKVDTDTLKDLQILPESTLHMIQNKQQTPQPTTTTA